MLLEVYHQGVRRVFRGVRGVASPFGHMFGGSAEYTGMTAYPQQPAVHVLFRLNLNDPAVGIRLPNTQWLPLLCAIRYGACDLGYRVESDSRVRILHQKEQKPWDGFPYDAYPESLPAQKVALEETPYDPTNPKHALRYAGVFGYDALTPEQRADLARHVVEVGLFVPGIMDSQTPEEFLEQNGWPFVQGPPVDDCPDPSCPNYGRRSSLRPFAIFQEGEKSFRQLWGRSCDDLQIIYQICPKCCAIRTNNQCT